MKKPAKIALVVTVAIVALILIGLLVLVLSSPRKTDFAHLVEPRILVKKDAWAMMTEFDGDPNVVIAEAFGKLMRSYFRLKDAPKGPGQPAPLARYRDIETVIASPPKGSIPWKGFVAIPVPDTVSSLPKEAGQEPYPLRLQRLEYGTVAEIVHFGPYEQETPPIQKLVGYIEEQGYEIADLHEEEYIKGPGLPFVSPRRYITIIRYRIRAR